MRIVVIQCPGCGEFASTDGKYRRECLGRTIPQPDANGFQRHCSECSRQIRRWVEDSANRWSREMPLWATDNPRGGA